MGKRIHKTLVASMIALVFAMSLCIGITTAVGANAAGDWVFTLALGGNTNSNEVYIGMSGEATGWEVTAWVGTLTGTVNLTYDGGDNVPTSVSFSPSGGGLNGHANELYLNCATYSNLTRINIPKGTEFVHDSSGSKFTTANAFNIVKETGTWAVKEDLSAYPQGEFGAISSNSNAPGWAFQSTVSVNVTSGKFEWPAWSGSFKSSTLSLTLVGGATATGTIDASPAGQSGNNGELSLVLPNDWQKIEFPAGTVFTFTPAEGYQSANLPEKFVLTKGYTVQLKDDGTGFETVGAEVEPLP